MAADKETIILDDGTEAWYYPEHDMIKAKDTGYIIKPPPSLFRDNPEQARAIAKSRWEQAREAAAAGLVETGAALGLNTPTEYKMWGLIAGKQAELALDISRGRSSTEAARFVGTAAGFFRDKDQSGADLAGAGAVLALSPEVAARLVAKLAELASSGAS